MAMINKIAIMILKISKSIPSIRNRITVLEIMKRSTIEAISRAW
jgi:hypothetical protein